MLYLHRAKKPETLRKVAEMVATSNPDAILTGTYYIAREENEDGKTIVGCIGLRRRGWHSTELHHLFVIPEERGKGIGKFLVESAEKRVKSPLCCCTIVAENETSISLHLGLGYRVAEEFTNTPTGRRVCFFTKRVQQP